MVTYSGVNHLAMVTADMTATIRFWRDLLGMRLVAGLGKTGYRHYFFEITAHDMMAFFEWPDVEKGLEKDHGVPVKGPVVFDHVSFEVVSDEDLWELKDKLEAAGVWVSEIVDHGFIHSLYTFDPNNIAIEFSAPVAGVDLRRNPRMLDRSAPPAGLEGPEPLSHIWPPVSKPTPKVKRRIYPGDGIALTTGEDDEAESGPSGQTPI
jgi:catechol 2,3-dioxygenase-like lactoylglutathione lyase family enzyme